MVLLDYLMVLYFLIWVELVVAVLLVLGLITMVLSICCCISKVLKAKRISCFSFLRQKVFVIS
jgi:hypothetical protein